MAKAAAKHGLSLFGLTEEHLAAIGSVCVAWAGLEQELAFFINELIPIPDPNGRSIISGIRGIEPKIPIARAFARIRIQEDEKFKMVDTTLTVIDKDLRPRRNQAIHSLWIADELPQRLKIEPKFYKQPFKARKVEFHHLVPMSDDDLRKLANELVLASNAIVQATMLYLRDCKDGPKPWPDICALLDRIRKQDQGRTHAYPPKRGKKSGRV
jgi:hypothetical protein